MKNIIKLAAMAVVAGAVSQTAHAAFITGNIGFTGEAVVNSTEASTATMVTQWNSTQITAAPGGLSGSFASAGLTVGEAEAFAAPWTFNDPSTPITSFWQVGGFTFALANSFVDPTGTGGTYPHGSIKVDVNGTVSGNGYQATAFAGTLTFADPNDGSGPMAFTAQWSFTPVPDGGTTVLLLGAALSGLAVAKRKFMA